jgi:DNA polymerase-3 subunit chi
MTSIEFHFNTPERLQHTCKLLRKARRQGFRIAVVGAPATLKALGSALWRFQDEVFLAHCTDLDAPEVQQASQIALGQDPHAWGFDDVLVNLGDAVPVDFGRFKRLVEIVANDEHGRDQARQRWKHYKSLGYELLKHDLSTSTTP